VKVFAGGRELAEADQVLLSIHFTFFAKNVQLQDAITPVIIMSA